jgi:hypothetical protein
MSNEGCQTTAEGYSVCDVNCGCAKEPAVEISLKDIPVRTSSKQNVFWEKARGGVMLLVSCITSPCCTPLIVPLIVALLAGTPIALWITQNSGWVYGALTLVSVISLMFGLRWSAQHLRG